MLNAVEGRSTSPQELDRSANHQPHQNQLQQNCSWLKPNDDGYMNASFSASHNSVSLTKDAEHRQSAANNNGKMNGTHENTEHELGNGTRPSRLAYSPPHPELYEQYPARQESILRMAVSIFFPFLLAGLGMVLAGIVLDEVQHWTVFKEVDELFVMVPALLGLKGNLEMTSASRLSTAANMGKMEVRGAWLAMATGSISITQAQSIVIGLLAGVVSIPLTFIQEMSVASFRWANFALLLCAGVVTSSVASLFLDTVMILLVTVCHRCNVNPDNVALPIAASLGDVGTLALLTVVSSGLWSIINSQFWVIPTITAVILALLPAWLFYARRNWFVRQVTADGWIPVISAMLISSAGGAIMKDVVYDFEYLAMYQPMMNGVGGNLAGVQASRLSTRLHQLFERPGSFEWRRISISRTNVNATAFEENAEMDTVLACDTTKTSKRDVGGCTKDEEEAEERRRIGDNEINIVPIHCTATETENHYEREKEGANASGNQDFSTAESVMNEDYCNYPRALRTPTRQCSKEASVAKTLCSSCSSDPEFKSQHVAAARTALKARIEGKQRARCDSGDVRSIGNYLDPSDQALLLQRGCPNPALSFCSRSSLSSTARLLIILLLPGEITFLYIIYAIHTGLVYTAAFLSLLLAASVTHLVVLLYLTHWLTQLLWRIGRDPDNFAVPYITAVGDILGSTLVAATFWLLRSFKDPMSIPNKTALLGPFIANSTVASSTLIELFTPNSTFNSTATPQFF